MSEKRLVSKILMVLRSNYPKCFFYKAYVGPYQERGIPDIVGCVNGRFIGLEVKTPGKKESGVTRYQELQLAKIKRAGGISTVVSSPEEALAAVGEEKS